MVCVHGSAGDSNDRVQCRLNEISVSAFQIVQLSSGTCAGGLGYSCEITSRTPGSMESVILLHITTCASTGTGVTSRGSGHAEVPKGEL